MSGFTDWDSELYHYGILGQKWGILRYQNKDGSLTPLGRKRYLKNGGYSVDLSRKERRSISKAIKKGNASDIEKAKAALLQKSTNTEDSVALNATGKKYLSKLIKSKKEYKNEAGVKLIESIEKENEERKNSSKIDKDVYGDSKKTSAILSKSGALRSIRMNARKISTEDLKKAVDRLNLEKQYSDLLKQQNRTLISSSAEVVGNILRKSAENIGTQWGTYGLGKLVNKIVGADIVNPKKGQKDK